MLDSSLFLLDVDFDRDFPFVLGREVLRVLDRCRRSRGDWDRLTPEIVVRTLLVLSVVSLEIDFEVFSLLSVVLDAGNGGCVAAGVSVAFNFSCFLSLNVDVVNECE